MFRLKELWIELVIVALVCGVLYALSTWVIDLVAVRVSIAADGQYLPIDDPMIYAIRGAVLGGAFLIASEVVVALHSAVNNPAQVFVWLFVWVGLWALIVLLTNPLWQSASDVVLLLVGAGTIWTVVPRRVGSYRTNVPRLM